MNEHAVVIAGLALGTFAIRLGGYLLGSAIPTSGPWARALSALPGCLIAALLSVLLIRGGSIEWVAAAISLGAALATRSLPLTMVAGVGTVWLLRSFG